MKKQLKLILIIHAYWNLHGLSTDIDEALLILKKLYKIDNKHTKAKIMIAALEGYKGNFICLMIYSSHLIQIILIQDQLNGFFLFPNYQIFFLIDGFFLMLLLN